MRICLSPGQPAHPAVGLSSRLIDSAGQGWETAPQLLKNPVSPNVMGR